MLLGGARVHVLIFAQHPVCRVAAACSAWKFGGQAGQRQSGRCVRGERDAVAGILFLGGRRWRCMVLFGGDTQSDHQSLDIGFGSTIPLQIPAHADPSRRRPAASVKSLLFVSLPPDHESRVLACPLGEQ